MKEPLLGGKAVLKTGPAAEVLEQEAAIMWKLRHPNLVACYGLISGPAQADGTRPLGRAMERMHPVSLLDRLEKR